MSKYGVEIKIDVSKIDKDRLFKGKKGTYLDMTVFLDVDNQGQFGDNGMVTHKKGEGEERAPILGNATVFWSDDSQWVKPQSNTQSNAHTSAPDLDDMDSSIPF